MKLSARNVLRGTIRKIEIGAVNAEITLEIAPGVEVVSIITANSVERLNLFVDKNSLRGNQGLQRHGSGRLVDTPHKLNCDRSA